LASLGSIFVDLILRKGAYDEGLSAATTGLNKFQRSAQRSLKQVGDNFSALARSVSSFGAALGVSIGGAGLAILSKQALNTADSISEMSLQLGLTAEDFQKFELGAKLGGVQAEKFEAAIGFLNNRIADGKTPYKNTNEAINDLAERMRLAKTSIERTAIATENFGAKTGRGLIPYLIGGKKGVKDLGDEAERLGIVFSQDLVDSANKFNDQLDILGEVVKKNFQRGLLEGFVDESGTIREIYTDPEFIAGVKSIGEAFGDIAKFVAQSVKAFQDAKIALAAFGIDLASRFNKNSPFAIDPEVAQQALLEANDRLNRAPKGGSNSNNGGPTGKLITGPTPEELKKRADVIKSINDALTKESVLVNAQVVNYGLKDSIIKSAQKAKEIEISLAEKGIVLSNSERQILQDKLTLLRENNERLEDLKLATKIIDDSKTALDKYNESVSQLNRLQAENLLTRDQFNKAMKKAGDDFAENDEETKKMKETVKELGLTFSSAFEDAISGGKGFQDILKGIESDLLRLGTRKLVTEPFANFFNQQFNQTGASGGFGGLFGNIGKLFGFATGGSFEIGGSGGSDSQLVAFRGTPGEKVTITRPDQQGGGNQIIMNITTPDAGSFMKSQGQILAQTQAALQRAQRRNS
jgi:hypothetical protein